MAVCIHSHYGGDILKNLSTMKNKKRNQKILCVLFIVMLLITASTGSAFAASNSWGLTTSQLDRSYFFQHIDKNNWSAVRDRCYINAEALSSRFNECIVETNLDKNVIHQLEYIYDKTDQTLAANYGTRWNSLNTEIGNIIADVDQLCGSGENVPVVNGKEVTTESYQNMISQIATKTSELSELVSEINSSYVSAQYHAVDITTTFYSSNYDIFTTLWNQLGLFITGIGADSDMSNTIFGVSWGADNITSIANSVSPFVKSFAYFLACALFGINVSRSALQFELMETKGQIKIFAGVILVKVWIDLAVSICIYIINIINDLTKQIINAFTYNAVAFTTFSSSSTDFTSNDSFNGLGSIINFIYHGILDLPYTILCVVLIISIISVILKLIARGFEMTALVTVSPIFFAMLVGDATKQYFRKFIGALLSTCCSLFFIAIVYAVATIWIRDSSVITDTSLSSVVTAFGTSFYRCLIVLAACRIIRKPPKVLLDLVNV